MGIFYYLIKTLVLMTSSLSQFIEFKGNAAPEQFHELLNFYLYVCNSKYSELKTEKPPQWHPLKLYELYRIARGVHFTLVQNIVLHEGDQFSEKRDFWNCQKNTCFVTDELSVVFTKSERFILAVIFYASKFRTTIHSYTSLFLDALETLYYKLRSKLHDSLTPASENFDLESNSPRNPRKKIKWESDSETEKHSPKQANTLYMYSLLRETRMSQRCRNSKLSSSDCAVTSSSSVDLPTTPTRTYQEPNTCLKAIDNHCGKEAKTGCLLPNKTFLLRRPVSLSMKDSDSDPELKALKKTASDDVISFNLNNDGSLQFDFRPSSFSQLSRNALFLRGRRLTKEYPRSCQHMFTKRRQQRRVCKRADSRAAKKALEATAKALAQEARRSPPLSDSSSESLTILPKDNEPPVSPIQENGENTPSVLNAIPTNEVILMGSENTVPQKKNSNWKKPIAQPLQAPLQVSHVNTLAEQSINKQTVNVWRVDVDGTTLNEVESSADKENVVSKNQLKCEKPDVGDDELTLLSRRFELCKISEPSSTPQGTVNEKTPSTAKAPKIEQPQDCSPISSDVKVDPEEVQEHTTEQKEPEAPKGPERSNSLKPSSPSVTEAHTDIPVEPAIATEETVQKEGEAVKSINPASSPDSSAVEIQADSCSEHYTAEPPGNSFQKTDESNKEPVAKQTPTVSQPKPKVTPVQAKAKKKPAKQPSANANSTAIPPELEVPLFAYSQILSAVKSRPKLAKPDMKKEELDKALSMIDAKLPKDGSSDFIEDLGVHKSDIVDFAEAQIMATEYLYKNLQRFDNPVLLLKAAFYLHRDHEQLKALNDEELLDLIMIKSHCVKYTGPLSDEPVTDEFITKDDPYRITEINIYSVEGAYHHHLWMQKCHKKVPITEELKARCRSWLSEQTMRVMYAAMCIDLTTRSLRRRGPILAWQREHPGETLPKELVDMFNAPTELSAAYHRYLKAKENLEKAEFNERIVEGVHKRSEKQDYKILVAAEKNRRENTNPLKQEPEVDGEDSDSSSSTSGKHKAKTSKRKTKNKVKKNRRRKKNGKRR
ncbi:hypothetical protein SJAG_03727 [Schizosaccharomyces japonicus yFS275]|uniref:Uncharacterized protein n=1 Tax=Schizosaccharomyces japonicus (strain yFS275 / FY16936) TaxID=402676 RepID=B6K2S9_SCHJY|nr:hypothetical protein SJAG_03727 [Schizosaccharomyces japonicus yFS275]EEB08569.2 hypothetical protein SJAG_03727 [Schizosaccharomyces japonicus yFS275]